MTDSTTQAILSAVRSLLIVVGSILTARGYMDDATVQTVIGAVMVLAPAVWGVFDKIASERKTAAREVLAVNAGIAVADATPGKTPDVTASTAPMIIAAAAVDSSTKGTT